MKREIRPLIEFIQCKLRTLNLHLFGTFQKKEKKKKEVQYKCVCHFLSVCVCVREEYEPSIDNKACVLCLFDLG